MGTDDIESSQERDERRKVDIPKRWVASAGQVVELIGMEAKGAAGGEMQGDDADGRTSKEECGWGA